MIKSQKKHTESATSTANHVHPETLNFSWALLVALRLAHQVSYKSPLEEHIFIMRWLETAHKRKIFPKSVARELCWFIGEGRRLGHRAGLRAKAEYIWHTGTNDLSQQSDLRRITKFFEAFRMLGWKNRLVADAEWENLKNTPLQMPTIYVRKSDLHSSFDINEKMVSCLQIKLNKEFAGVALLARDASLTVKSHGREGGLVVFSVTP